VNLLDTLDRALPQTQCQRCGFPACRPYAQALIDGEAKVNQCPPGGQAGADRLATLLGLPKEALDTSRGQPGVAWVARIDPAFCIGCTKCMLACPVDAIIGANKRMHTIIADQCTGCELCLPPCPTDCIRLEPRSASEWSDHDAALALERYRARESRSKSNEAAPKEVIETSNDAPATPASARFKALEAALAQAKQRLAPNGG
jgi:Na+-translocating ferredoxin:NAD+ oxidoreductase subunit B